MNSKWRKDSKWYKRRIIGIFMWLALAIIAIGVAVWMGWTLSDTNPYQDQQFYAMDRALFGASIVISSISIIMIFYNLGEILYAVNRPPIDKEGENDIITSK